MADRRAAVAVTAAASTVAAEAVVAVPAATAQRSAGGRAADAAAGVHQGPSHREAGAVVAVAAVVALAVVAVAVVAVCDRRRRAVDQHGRRARLPLRVAAREDTERGAAAAGGVEEERVEGGAMGTWLGTGRGHRNPGLWGGRGPPGDRQKQVGWLRWVEVVAAGGERAPAADYVAAQKVPRRCREGAQKVVVVVQRREC